MSVELIIRAGIRSFFGTADIGIRYLETGHLVSGFRYWISVLKKKTYICKKFKTLLIPLNIFI